MFLQPGTRGKTLKPHGRIPAGAQIVFAGWVSMAWVIIEYRLVDEDENPIRDGEGNPVTVSEAITVTDAMEICSGGEV